MKDGNRTEGGARAPAIAAVVAAAVLVATGCEGRAPRADRGTSAGDATATSKREGAAGASLGDGPSVAEIDLSRGVPEARGSSLLGPSSRRSHVDLVRSLRALADGGEGGSSTTKGVFVRLGTGAIGLARAEEIGGLLGEVRKTRPVVCHADEYGNATLMLAAMGCSKVWVSPAGGVEAVGIAAQLLFANRLLERFHVGVDFLQVGKYKGAEEPFTRDGPSPEARESLEGTLRGLRAAWLSHIAEGRGKLEAGDAAEDGPFGPADALARGLVDAVGDADDARDDAQKLAGADRVVSRFGGESAGGGHPIAGLLRALTGSARGGTPHVAVVPAVGSIAMSSSPSLVGGSEGITEHELGRVLARLTTDAQVKAVVLRIDSPGGSALASDLLWKRLRKLAAEKPLVVSVGDMAASGGYYLSCAGTKIVAEPTSIVGSIGVVGGKLSLGKALDDLGVHAETIPAASDPKKAARAGYMSSFTPWDAPTRERVLSSMKGIYDLFLQRIAEGRGTKVEAIAPHAEGRIFGGVEAKERGLVDEIGGLSDAIALAVKLASLPKDAPVEVVDEEPGLLELLDEGAEGAGSRATAGQAVEAGVGRAARETVLPPALLSAVPGVEALVGSLAPLVAGERALTAVPFALTVR